MNLPGLVNAQQSGEHKNKNRPEDDPKSHRVLVAVLPRNRDQLIQGDEHHHTAGEGQRGRDKPAKRSEKNSRQQCADRLSQPG